MTAFKNCPYCGEEIRFQAKKCKHCGEWIGEKQVDIESDQAELVDESTIVNNEQGKKVNNLVVESTHHDWMRGNMVSNIVVICLFIVSVLLHFSVPDEDNHWKVIEYNISQYYAQSNLENKSDNYNDNGEYVYPSKVRKLFEQNNELQYEKNWFWSYTILKNRKSPEESKISFGVFGMVFTTIKQSNIDFGNSDVDSSIVDTSQIEGEVDVDYKLITTTDRGGYGYYLGKEGKEEFYEPFILCYDIIKNKTVKYFSFDSNATIEQQTKVKDEDDLWTELNLDYITEYYVKGDQLYFVGFSSMLRSGLYYGVSVDLSTDKLKIIAYGDDMSINQNTGELNYTQLRLTKDVGYEAGNEYETVYLKTKLN